MEIKCPKCGSNKYQVKNIIMPEKNSLLKVELNLYYAKTCLNCGYTEFYSAKIVDSDEVKQKVGKKNADKKLKTEY